MKKILFSIFFCFISHLIFSQKNSVADVKFSVNTAPLSLIDVYSGMSYRLGTEIKVYRNFSISAEGGGYFYHGGYKEDVNGFVMRTNFKLYLNGDQLTVGNYISFEHTYKNLRFDLADSFYISPGPMFVKTYRTGRSANTIMIKFGSTKIYGERFIFEWYMGSGVRFENSSSTLSPQEVDGRKENTQDYISGFERKLGNWVVPVANIGIKVGWRIK